MLRYRDAVHEDYRVIASFPQDPRELYYMFPKGKFPIPPDQLEQVGLSRYSPTVITHQDEVVGYCNLYDVTTGKDCWLGNVIVHPKHRGAGVGTFLFHSISQRARTEYGCREIKLVCHNTNTEALLFYHKLGLKPFDLKIMEDYRGYKVAGIMMSKPL